MAMATLMALSASACSEKAAEHENIRPPQPGTPARPADVQGIYRTVHQGLLQLRANGSFVLIVPEGPGPSGGSYTLENGVLTVRTDVCGSAVGDYRVVVSGTPLPGQAILTFISVSDDCDARRRYLTIDPWVYANS
jgi:hypothetical protein